MYIVQISVSGAGGLSVYFVTPSLQSGQSWPIVARAECVTLPGLAKVLTNSQIGVQLKLSGPYYGH